MTKALFTGLLLFSVNSHAQAEKLLAACAGVQVEQGTNHVDVISVKVIQEFGSTQTNLLVYKNQNQILKLPVTITPAADGAEYKTGKFHTRVGVPSYLELTVKEENFQATGTLMEISFGPEIGTTQLSCAF